MQDEQRRKYPRGRGKDLNFTILVLPTHCTVLNRIKSMKCVSIPTSTSPIKRREEDNPKEIEFLFQNDSQAGFQDFSLEYNPGLLTSRQLE